MENERERGWRDKETINYLHASALSERAIVIFCSTCFFAMMMRKKNILKYNLFQEEPFSSSGGYAESPPDAQSRTEDDRRRRKKQFTLDFEDEADRAEVFMDSMDVSPTPSHRHRPREKISSVGRTPHRTMKRRDSLQQQLLKSPQKEDWRVEGADDGAHVPTSDDSSCSHHYHMYHHSHTAHKDTPESFRHRRTRDSPRRNSGGYVSAGRRSNEVGH